jgi:hypothetical protein
MKEFISSAANTIVPAFLVLKAKGFQVYRTKVVGHEEEWVAEKGETKFTAEDPVTLLGVQAIYESRQSDWKATDGEVDNFLKEFP